MGPPGPSPVLHYYGGVDTVGSYYWENLPGCHVAVDFFMDEDGNAARRIARERQLDFVTVTAQPAFVLELQWLQLGRIDKDAARRTLAFRLANPPSRSRPPGWKNCRCRTRRWPANRACGSTASSSNGSDGQPRGR